MAVAPRQRRTTIARDFPVQLPDHDVIDAARSSASAANNFDLWNWLAWAGTAIVTALGTTVGLLYKTTETRNARDIATLTEQCNRLQKKVDELTSQVSDLKAENAAIKKENEWLTKIHGQHLREIEQHQRDQ